MGKTGREVLSSRQSRPQATSGARADIAPQFEHIRFVRDFMAHNPGKSLKEAVLAGKVNRQQSGERKYRHQDESKDLLQT